MKQKILDYARQLYNTHGLSTVTARVICADLNISLGSFSYHFPDKKIILQSLYEAMLVEIQTIYTSIQDESPSIITYLDSHKSLFLIQEKYKFFYLNLFEILSQHPEIKKVHLKKRSEEMYMARQVFQHYMNMGILKKDISAEQMERLINVGQLLHTFWPIDSEIASEVPQNHRLTHYMKICCGLVEPFLELPYKEAYHNYFNRLTQKQH